MLQDFVKHIDEWVLGPISVGVDELGYTYDTD